MHITWMQISFIFFKNINPTYEKPITTVVADTNIKNLQSLKNATKILFHWILNVGTPWNTPSATKILIQN